MPTSEGKSGGKRSWSTRLGQGCGAVAPHPNLASILEFHQDRATFNSQLLVVTLTAEQR